MASERAAGRPNPRGLGYPDGCSGLATSALARCAAELRGQQCLLCIRKGAFPAPASWDAWPGWRIAGSPSIQAVRIAPRGPGNWAVVVFTGDRRVHGRFPVILCDNKQRAIRLMFDRAWQINQCCPQPFGRDGETWKAGDFYLTVAEPCG